ncbi:MAG TPA: biotin--[acetyl-CoA-carboxylase] ligase [Microvirga sp.]|nr:biotin--[acetyl-CoA-carboxylase] ligase [Microvirga sp.]
MRLPPEIESAGYRLLSLDSTESTNDDALRAAREGDPGPLWVIAVEQRAGRGRHGRPWASPPGNLYASLLLTDPCDAALAPQLGFVAGLALHEAVETVTGASAPRLALKWPNDLLFEEAKVSGLLLEGHRIGATLAVVIGFGVNVASAPSDTPYAATALHRSHPSVTRESVFSALSRCFADVFEGWRSSQRAAAADPFASIRRRWLERAAGIGSEVTIRLPSGERRGIFEGLDRSGRLQLRTAAGLELIDAGDLYFPASNNITAVPSAGTRS